MFSDDEILNSIKSLKSKCSSGTDGLCIKMLKCVKMFSQKKKLVAGPASSVGKYSLGKILLSSGLCLNPPYAKIFLGGYLLSIMRGL